MTIGYIRKFLNVPLFESVLKGATMGTQKKTKTTAKAKKTTKTRKATSKSAKKVSAPSYEVIAERAWCIWQDNGCQPGRDEHNWFEAVAQLETELVSC